MNTLPASAKWPNVPACYEWLSLDRRGDWRLQGERVAHRGLIEFINRHYTHDDAGNWLVNNGPQRVYVDLACTPWVFRREGDAFVSQTGQPAGAIKAILLDEEGSLLLEAETGIGLLDDRDLASLLADASPNDEASLLAVLSGEPVEVRWKNLRLERVTAATLPGRYGFNPTPRP